MCKYAFSTVGAVIIYYLTLGLLTLNKILELSLRAFLLPPIEFLNILVNKKLYYIIVPIKEAKLKKKINSDIGE